jgi:hypothetical protein
MRKLTLSIFALVVTFTMQAKAQTITELPVGYKFYIQSAINYGQNTGGYWDIPGKPDAIQKGSNIQVWSLDDGHDRIFTIIESPEKGYYELQVGNTTNARVDISGGKREDATNVQVWDRNGMPPQRFQFRHLGNGRFKIFDRNGRALCLARRSSANGSNVHIWGDHNGAWMEWYLIDVQTKQPVIPSSISTSASSSEVRLGAGEEMVLGRIGLFDNGDLKYTFSVVRKANKTKEVYRRVNEPYSPDILSSGREMTIDQNPPEHDLFDYFVIFNGKRFGPYDRIVEMHQLESDIDKWISACGKYISFAFQRGNRFFPVIANVEDTYPFRGTHTAPVFDVKSGKNTRILRWSETDFRLKENDNFRLRGWHSLRDVSYSTDGSRLLYIGTEKQGDHASLYVNHQKVSGTYPVGVAGFIPNTNIHYYLNADRFVVGSKNLELPGSVHDRRWFVGDYMIIAPRSRQDYNDMYKHPYFIWEYNHKTDEIKTIDGFFGDVRLVTAKGSSTAYFRTFASNGDCLLVKQGGEILQRVTKAQYGDSNVRFAVSKNGDILTAYQDSKRKVHVLLNGKPLASVGYTEHLPRRVDFCEISGKPIVEIAIGTRTNNNRITRIILGDKVLDFNYERPSHEFYRSSGNDMFVMRTESHQEFQSRSKFTVLKNNQPLYTDSFTRIAQFSLSCDGMRHALIAYRGSKYFSYAYIPENNVMHEKWELIVDGKVVEGNFGAPVWSKNKQKFLTLKQEGNSIRIIEL